MKRGSEEMPGQGKARPVTPANRCADCHQGKHPIDQIDAYVCGLHFYNGDMSRQVIAHHFCSHCSEEFLQCVIYDTNKSDARLIGEYNISARLFVDFARRREAVLAQPSVCQIRTVEIDR